MRFINNDHTSSLNDLLKSTNTQPLHVHRIKQMACEVFKIINKMSPEYINDLVEIKTLTYNFRAEKQAEVPRVNTTRYGLRPFRSEADGYGTAFQMRCGLQNHTPSSEG